MTDKNKEVAAKAAAPSKRKKVETPKKYKVKDGITLCCSARGVLKGGETLTVKDISGGEKALEKLVKTGLVVAV